nr:hypothetical protein [Tanacetum cinerariifolium]
RARVGKSVGVGAGGAGGGGTLKRNIRFLGRVDDEVAQVVLHRRAVGDDRALAATDVAGRFLLVHRRLAVVGHVGDDGHVGVDAVGN